MFNKIQTFFRKKLTTKARRIWPRKGTKCTKDNKKWEKSDFFGRKAPKAQGHREKKVYQVMRRTSANGTGEKCTT